MPSSHLLSLFSLLRQGLFPPARCPLICCIFPSPSKIRNPLRQKEWPTPISSADPTRVALFPPFPPGRPCARLRFPSCHSARVCDGVQRDRGTEGRSKREQEKKKGRRKGRCRRTEPARGTMAKSAVSMALLPLYRSCNSHLPNCAASFCCPEPLSFVPAPIALSYLSPTPLYP